MDAHTKKIVSEQDCLTQGEFFKSFCEDNNFISGRRKVLRCRAGLREEDTKLVFHPVHCDQLSELMHIVPKFRFIILESLRTCITEREVESDHNFDIVIAYLASFAHDLPRRKELEVSLTWASSHYRLNPWRRIEQHEARHRSLPGQSILNSGTQD
ncbi:unnamed protein product [Cladocopium goreaui]|uniref:Uncharacterized protein n=1 Tax=Cladocopium goreaui TaxID=2562237 RepID=A0A9P1CYJ5_9DINO|nr:unnamed protein product [Cladocopium goreaui]